MGTTDEQEKALSSRTILSFGFVSGALLFSIASFLLTCTGFYYAIVMLKWGAGIAAFTLALHTVKTLKKKNNGPSFLIKSAYSSLILSVLCISWLFFTSIVLAVL